MILRPRFLSIRPSWAWAMLGTQCHMRSTKSNWPRLQPRENMSTNIAWKWTSIDTSGKSTFSKLENKILLMNAITAAHRAASLEPLKPLLLSLFSGTVLLPNATASDIGLVRKISWTFNTNYIIRLTKYNFSKRRLSSQKNKKIKKLKNLIKSYWNWSQEKMILVRSRQYNYLAKNQNPEMLTLTTAT